MRWTAPFVALALPAVAHAAPLWEDTYAVSLGSCQEAATVRIAVTEDSGAWFGQWGAQSTGDILSTGRLCLRSGLTTTGGVQTAGFQSFGSPHEEFPSNEPPLGGVAGRHCSGSAQNTDIHLHIWAVTATTWVLTWSLERPLTGSAPNRLVLDCVAATLSASMHATAEPDEETPEAVRYQEVLVWP